ncbi:hypothetical protein KP79_PYT19050 [Mizuhopecten yessoensis]|uniref:Uncharacterized protein n=1 Tax=Mizuhopecten yessoensis TaxID=6573 RepID=A0A210PVJ7_MIZYE|nr:hypothetical protein KP79_PYT19050 [Mizuhopecten yessoensis]
MDELLVGDPAVRPGTIVSSMEGNSSSTACSTYTAPASSTVPASSTAPALKKPQTSPARKEKRKRKREEMPDWFREFSDQQNKILSEMKETQQKAVRVAEDRNSILKSLAAALVKK